MISKIYKITNLINNKLYIGFTSLSISDRFSIHNADSRNIKNNKPLYRAIRKYKIENFIIESIYESLDKNYTLEVMEEYFIKEYRSLGFTLYNVQDGGSGYKNNPKSKPVNIFDKDLLLVKTTNSMSEASRFIGVPLSNLKNAVDNSMNNKGSRIKDYYVSYHGYPPVKKDCSYLTERNRQIKPYLGKKRPAHSKFMKDNPPSCDNTVYCFKHILNKSFVGTRIELINAYPDDKISTSMLGTMISGKQKSHRGWYI